MSQEHRIFISLTPEQCRSLPATTALSERDAHHLTRVLRFTDGRELIAVDINSHAEFRAKLQVKETTSTIRIVERRNNTIRLPRVGCLGMAIIKGDHNDLVVEKATELGVGRIIIYQADRSVVKVKGDTESAKKCSRWQRIAESAAKQSHQVACPAIHFAASVEQFLELAAQNRSSNDIALLCSLSASAKPLREIPMPIGQATIVIGPEGDFTNEEENLICNANYLQISLGENVLRSETAAITGVALVNGLWGSPSNIG